MLRLARETVGALRASASSGGSVDGLREAGFSGGTSLYEAFSDWSRERGGSKPADMPLAEFSFRARAFFLAIGWGVITLSSADDALAVIEVDGGWEAGFTGDTGGCHVTTGALAGFLTPLADYPVAVMEVDCGREGGSVCRFLAGNAEMLEEAYDRLVGGEGWESVAQSPTAG
jgi:Predicted hydrocarbon binding protein (contains V4R domain)